MDVQSVAEIFSKWPDVEWLAGIPIHWDRENRIFRVLEKNISISSIFELADMN
jgi:hypothetical protein